MVVGASGNEGISELLETVGERLRVLHDLILVGLEFWRGGHLQTCSQSGDGVVVWTTLVSREHREVDLVGNVVHDRVSLLVVLPHTLPVEDHGSSWSSERLVSGGGDDVGIVEWGLNDASGDKTTDVSHVGKKPSVRLVADLSHSSVVIQSRVGARSSDNELWSEEGGVLLERIVVDEPGLLVQSVWHGLEVDGHGTDLLLVGLVTVTEVTTVRQVKSHNAVVWIQERAVHVEVGRRPREGLHVHSPLFRVEPESLESSLLAKALCHVNELVTSVVSRTWITFRVLVGHDTSQSLHDGLACEVL
mmetsp:Transcript_5554/g.15704  ORF Transcript_5554/g.15704 Transcript_5554/m.15704 type:complete len:304 (-) Transcript_5554:314-1225(-)